MPSERARGPPTDLLLTLNIESKGFGNTDILLILLLALAFDLAFGEPPRPIHPVVWLGKVISLLERGGLNLRPVIQFLYGTGITIAVIGLFAVPVYLILNYLNTYSLIAYIVLGAVLLKPAFCLKEQWQVALKVRRLLSRRKPAKNAPELAKLFSSVSRNGEGLPEPLVISATIRSLAENACDFFVAPLFYFLLLGVPGAIGYRVVNTLDSMLGYHGKYEYLGKFAARLDDVLNYIPARLTMLLLVLATFLSKKDTRTAWQVAFSEHNQTESPNAGWPMAAMAGALNVQLEKAGHYKLGKANIPLTPETIDASIGLFYIAVLTWTMVCFIAITVI